MINETSSKFKTSVPLMTILREWKDKLHINKEINQLKNSPKIWTDTSPEKIYRRELRPYKGAQRHLSLGNWELQPQWGTTQHVSEWWSPWWCQVPARTEQLELSYSAGGKTKWYSHFDSFWSSWMTHSLLEPTILLLHIYSREKNVHTKTHIVSVCRSSIHNF